MSYTNRQQMNDFSKKIIPEVIDIDKIHFSKETRISRNQWKQSSKTNFISHSTVPSNTKSNTFLIGENLAVRNSKFGLGLFATRDIPEGTVLLYLSGRRIHFYEALTLGEKESYPIQVSADNYLMTEFPFYFTNHSCDPNCGVNENLELISLKKIRKGEEIFWDYSTSMLERHWTMYCDCGSEVCRKIITDFDHLPKEIQEYYTNLGIVQPFIKELIDNVTQSDIHKHLNVIRNNSR